MLLKEQYDVLVKSLLPYAQKRLGFDKPPKIKFVDDNENAKNPLGKTAYYHPEDKEITVFVTNRHPKDILRSVAHELVHYKQDCDGRLTKAMRQDLHDKNYTQNNPELREFEEEAYLDGNMTFRDWEDNYKNGSKKIIIAKESKQMNESTLRNHIRKMISEIISEEKKKEEEQRADVSCPRPSARTKELSKYKIAEEVEEDSTLNEWKNQELFGLLTKRFGILSEGKMPMKKDKEDVDGDGDTSEEVPAFLEKGDVKKKKTSGKIPPQLQKYVKSKKGSK